jgi:hypothetical protein
MAQVLAFYGEATRAVTQPQPLPQVVALAVVLAVVVVQTYDFSGVCTFL